MKRVISLLIVIVLLCSVMTPVSSVNAAASKGVKEEYLNSDRWLSLSKNKTGARYFVDSKNNPVILFGQARSQNNAGKENTLYSPVASADALVEHYADYGMNFMRLAINIESLCGGKKRTAAEINDFIARVIDPDVQAIIRNGMYVMLDIHMYPDPEGERTARTLVQFARDYYLPVLVELAKKYKDEPMVAVYEIWNEPYPADIAAPPPEDKEGDWLTQLRLFFMDAVKEIRKYDTRHVIMVSDHNAGWGAATNDIWGGYYDKIDPVYNNVCYSIHCGHDQLEDDSIGWYSNHWTNLAKTQNICLLFGEIETELASNSAEGMQNFLDFFMDTKDEYYFSGAIWRPHGASQEFHDLWGDSGWVKKYVKMKPTPTMRYASDTEDYFGEKSKFVEVTKDTTFFGVQDYGTAISMLPALSATDYYETTTEIKENIVYKSGKYKLVVRAAGKSGYTGDFIVGYKDVDGVIHQIARFGGKNSNMVPYYQTAEFTSSKKISSFVFFSCESKNKSVFIDRVYLTGAKADKETYTRTKENVEDAKKIIDLSGKSYTLKSTNDNTSTPSDTTSTNDSDDKKPEDDKSSEGITDSETATPDDSDVKTVTEKVTKNEKIDLTLYIIIALGVFVILATVGIVSFVVLKKKRDRSE